MDTMNDPIAERSAVLSAALWDAPRRARLPFFVGFAGFPPRRGRRSPPTTQSCQRASTSPVSKVPFFRPASVSAKARS